MVRVYILHSEAKDRYYVGFSSRPRRRLREHRRGMSTATSPADDWVDVWHVDVASTAAARVLEKKIKARGARRFLSEQ